MEYTKQSKLSRLGNDSTLPEEDKDLIRALTAYIGVCTDNGYGRAKRKREVDWAVRMVNEFSRLDDKSDTETPNACTCGHKPEKVLKVLMNYSGDTPITVRHVYVDFNGTLTALDLNKVVRLWVDEGKQ